VPKALVQMETCLCVNIEILEIFSILTIYISRTGWGILASCLLVTLPLFTRIDEDDLLQHKTHNISLWGSGLYKVVCITCFEDLSSPYSQGMIALFQGEKFQFPTSTLSGQIDRDD